MSDASTAAGPNAEENAQRREYYRRKASRESQLVAACRPLGEALLQRRQQGFPISLRDPSVKRLVDQLIPKVKGWHAAYSRWRSDQGRPLAGSYEDLPRMEKPRQRIIAAGKEIGYRLSINEKDRARAALRDLVKAAEDEARERQRRAGAREAQEKKQAAKQEQE